MPRELIFLVSAPSTESGIETGVLCRIKTTGSGDADPLVAFVSEAIGHQFIAGRRLSGHVSLLSLSGLATDQENSAKAQKILLFEHSGQLARYLEEGEKFDFANLVVSFEDAARRLQTAL